jgi:hypothetical protein
MNLNKMLIILGLLLSIVPNALSQGRLLRGVESKQFSLLGNKADFYVSPMGNDAWSGTLPAPNLENTDGPFATISKAKTAVRELKQEIYQPKKTALDKRFRGSPHAYGRGRDILVLIRDGVYSLDSAIEFSSQDGGERIETDLPTGAFEYHKLKDYYVTYASYPGETAVISGGRAISGWKKTKDGLWAAPCDDEVVALFANGKRQMLARTPNSGHFVTAEQPTDPTQFKFNPGELNAWPGLASNRITLTIRWGTNQRTLSKIDEKSHTAFLNLPAEEMLFVPPKYFVENVKALLDTTGEWFYDKNEKMLYYLPDEGIKNPNDAVITTPFASQLINVAGSRQQPVRNLCFYNLTFQTTQSGGGATMQFVYAKNCKVLKNTLTNIDQTAIVFGLGCYHNQILHNTIHDVIGSGINVRGTAIPESWLDVVSDNMVSFNSVTKCRPAAGGIHTANALRTTISHNYVSSTGSYGITAGSWPNVEESSDGNHLVEYNHVSFTNLMRDDEGGIAVYGLSHGSIVRHNIVHDVHPAATNENVGLFFQNMAKGWTVTDNIYYNLKQGEMKYCAAYPVDNVYADNFIVQAPVVEPERYIDGEPRFVFSELKINGSGDLKTGKKVAIFATVFNHGSSGIQNVHLYLDGRIAKTKKCAVLAKNSNKIVFITQFADPGEHTVAVGNTPHKTLEVSGKARDLLYDDMKIAQKEIPFSQPVTISAAIKNVHPDAEKCNAPLFVDGAEQASKTVSFRGEESERVQFDVKNLAVGSHSIAIGDHAPVTIRIYPHRQIDIANADFSTYCSGTAQSCSFDFDPKINHFSITASGTDFLHAEDSYGAIYLDDVITGNFVATVKVNQFGEDVSEWFRAGIFVRNDIAKSTEAEKGSKGAFLLFSTPKRIGAQWDEFGGGSMHNTKSYNYTKEQPFPVWLKLVRHGNSFDGYYSFDGVEWMLARTSGELPDLSETMDIGLAGGSNDQRPSNVVFEDFRLDVEEK